MARDTLLGFPAHTLPYRRGKFITLSTASAERRNSPFRFLLFTVFYAFFTLRAMISGSTQKKVNSPVASSFSSSPRMSTATRQVEWPR